MKVKLTRHRGFDNKEPNILILKHMSNNKSFEKSIERLEEIVDKMESGDLALEEAMNCYEEGIKLSRFCYTKLSEAEKKIEKLVKSKGKPGKEEYSTEELDLFKNESKAE